MRTPERPWPVAPRPFPDEALGGWFGRVAARYRMDVDQLAAACGLGLEAAAHDGGWLALSSLPMHSILEMARLARIDVDRLVKLQQLVVVGSRVSQFAFCFRCLYVNDLDVASPYWKAEWLVAETGTCAVHGSPLEFVPRWAARKHRNLDRLMRFISCRKQRQEARRLHVWY